MNTGIIKFFDAPRNFGMIEPHEKGPDVFFHRSDLEEILSPQPGVWVTFEVVPGYKHKNGTLKASKVSLCRKRGDYVRETREKVIPFGKD